MDSMTDHAYNPAPDMNTMTIGDGVELDLSLLETLSISHHAPVYSIPMDESEANSPEQYVEMEYNKSYHESKQKLNLKSDQGHLI